MTFLLFILLMLILSLASVKLAANILEVDNSGFGTCLLAVILSVIAYAISTVLIGDSFFSYLVSIIISGLFFSFVFSVNAFVGFVLALISSTVQLVFGIIAITFGISVMAI